MQFLATRKLLAGEELGSPVDVSAWPMGYWALEGLDGSGWIGKFTSGEVGVSV
jgi:hypothetical protein